MTDDLVKRLRDREDLSASYGITNTIFMEAADRIEFLEAALLKIHMLAEARSHHAWDSHATYYRISTAALDGEKDDE